MKAKISAILMGAAIGSMAVISYARADSTTIDAVVEMLEAIQVGNEQDIQFGTIGTTGGVPGPGDTITISSDGTLTTTGIFSGPATATPGSVDVTAGSDGQVLEVSCTTFANMTNGAGAQILLGIRAAAEDSTGPYSGDSPCQGLGTPATTFTLNTGVLDTVYFSASGSGATMVNFTEDSFSTGNAGGTDITIDISYQ